MKIRKIALAAAALAVIGLGTACVPETGEPVATPTTAYTPGYTPQWPPTTTQAAAPKAKDALTADGDFKVGTAPGQIPPGEYQVVVTGATGSGYFEVCSDLACKMTMGADKGLISNEFVTADGFTEIPANAAYIKNKRGLTFIPMGA